MKKKKILIKVQHIDVMLNDLWLCCNLQPSHNSTFLVVQRMFAGFSLEAVAYSRQCSISSGTPIQPPSSDKAVAVRGNAQGRVGTQHVTLAELRQIPGQ